MLWIYHTSDLHDRRGFVPRLREIRAACPGLLFDCGDSLRGSQTMYYRREPILQELDDAAYDAQAVGNREFHYLFGLLRARASQMRHPLVCTNLIDTKGRALPFARSWRCTVARDSAPPLTVHVLGLLAMQYPTRSGWERIFGWRFLDPIEAVNSYAESVPMGETLVVLSHLGLARDRELARRIPRIDLVLGGHSHDTLYSPAYVGAVPIVHAGPYARYVSRTQLAYDDSTRRFTIGDFSLIPLLQRE
jgi:2',3'-cyclic-nucleotide 2'-phosphodiesterase (5'-nucleotidase family)